MAPRLSTKAHAKTDHGQSESNSQDASQDSGVALGQMASRFGDQMKKKSAERRQASTTTIKTAHSARVVKLNEEVKACFDNHDKQLRALRRPNIERLTTLTRKKHELEAAVDKCLADLSKSFQEAAQQVQASVDGRIEDLSG